MAMAGWFVEGLGSWILHPRQRVGVDKCYWERSEPVWDRHKHTIVTIVIPLPTFQRTAGSRFDIGFLPGNSIDN